MMSQLHLQPQIKVTWKDLYYEVVAKPSVWTSLTRCNASTNAKPLVKRSILNGLSGHFSSGQLTGVMGPSGSGKTTMLECICGFRNLNFSVDLRVTQSDPERKIKVAIVQQNNCFIETFTVREMLLYAWRLYTHSGSKVNSAEIRLNDVTIHQNRPEDIANVNSSQMCLVTPDHTQQFCDVPEVVAKVIDQLGLQSCVDTRANQCSGGQRKRISIALEMLSEPNILILDEPTSGLDSSACYHTMCVMRSLATDPVRPMALVCTIHQPSARVFDLIDHLYVIGLTGHCIYEGPPSNMLNVLAAVGLHCPMFHNPADFIAKVAAGDHGLEPLGVLSRAKQCEDERHNHAEGGTLVRSLVQHCDHGRALSLDHVIILTSRCSLQTVRDPVLTVLRLSTYLGTAFFLVALYGRIGHSSMCPLLVSPLHEPELFASTSFEHQRELLSVAENVSFLFFTLMFIAFGGLLSTIMNFPRELCNVRKERVNGWYGTLSYYVAFSVAEVPYQVACASAYCVVAYPLTGQVLQWWRMIGLLAINLLTALVAQSLGLLFGALYMENATMAVFLGPISMVPMMLFSGFFIPLPRIPWYMRPLTYVSFVGYAIEITVVIVYGYGRCAVEPSVLERYRQQTQQTSNWAEMADQVLGKGGQQMVKKFTAFMFGSFDPGTDRPYRSMVLDQFDYHEHNVATDFAVMILFLVVTRVVTYFVINHKINKRD